MRNLDYTAYKEISFLLPPLPEQKKIAEVLSSVDEAIAATKAVIDQTKQVKKGLLQTLLTKGIGHTKFKQTELGEIPEIWEVCSVEGVITSIDSGWSPNCEKVPAPLGDWGVLKTSSVHWDGFFEDENKKLPNSLEPRPNIQVQAGDVLITRAGPAERTGVVAYVRAVRERLMLSDKLIRLKANLDLISGEYLSLILSSPMGQQQLFRKKSGMALSQTNISQKILKETLVAVPPLSEQNEIVAALDASLSAHEKSNLKLNQLLILKSGLMSDLLTGRKRVEV
ncbi:hypothetical protein THS27_00730 [Thalassospira sp. MCCC 1A01428]|nr:hypothetical protein THS27_00730 [Thalassospira sp. MCCC 1A01428]